MAALLGQEAVVKALLLNLFRMQVADTFFHHISYQAIARKFIILGALLLVSKSHAQETLSELLSKFNTKSVPYITVQELAMPKTKATILDAREVKEFNVSHIKNAIHVGHDNFNLEQTTQQLKNKQQTIVVYCSLGIRSEDIAEQLKKAGYRNVKNLYGGIFEWKNNNFPIYNAKEKETDSIHIFSNEWGKWLTKGHKVF